MESNLHKGQDYKFKKLVKSVKEFPQMLKLRPIIIDKNNIILGGNMRYKACVEIGLKEVYIIKAHSFNEEQLKEFIIKDNVGYGQWDWDIIANQWDTQQLNHWGLETLELEETFDEGEITEDDNENNKNEVIIKDRTNYRGYYDPPFMTCQLLGVNIRC